MADSTFSYEIRTQADLRAAKAFRAALEEQIRAARAAGQSTTALEAKLKQLDGAMDRSAQTMARANKVKKESSGLLTELERKFPMLGRAMELLKSPLGLVVSLLTGLTLGLRLAIREFAAGEVATTKYAAALAQAGKLTDANVQSGKALASQLQQLTGIADDKWLTVIAKLIQFGSDEASLGMNVEAVKNLAGILGRGEDSLAAAGLLVAKVIQGNTSALSEYGIQADQTLPKAEQIRDVLNKIARAGGGQLEAQLDTLNGQWTAMKNSAGDLAEAVGGVLNQNLGLKDSLGALGVAFDFWAAKIGAWTRQSVSLANNVNALKVNQEAAAEAARRHAEALEAIKRGAEGAAQKITALREEQEALRRFQDEQEDIQLAIDLERLKRRGLPESQRLREEQRLRAESTRRKQAREVADKETLIDEERKTIEVARTDQFVREGVVETLQDKLARQLAFEAERAKLAGLQEQFDRIAGELDVDRELVEGFFSGKSFLDLRSEPALIRALQGDEERMGALRGLHQSITAQRFRVGHADARRPRDFGSSAEITDALNKAKEAADLASQLNQQRIAGAEKEIATLQTAIDRLQILNAKRNELESERAKTQLTDARAGESSEAAKRLLTLKQFLDKQGDGDFSIPADFVPPEVRALLPNAGPFITRPDILNAARGIRAQDQASARATSAAATTDETLTQADAVVANRARANIAARKRQAEKEFEDALAEAFGMVDEVAKMAGEFRRELELSKDQMRNARSR